MLIDLASAAFPDLTSVDLCIIGSGAAGLTLATELEGSKLSVLLLEAGGLSYSVASQQAYSGHTTGQTMFPLEGMRLRYFGGTTGHWTGLCRPLDEADFVEKAWVPDSGWPICKTDLDPFIARTHRILDLNEVEYDLARLAPHQNHFLQLSPHCFHHEVWRVSAPTRFGSKYREAMQRARDVRVLLNASVTELVLEPGGTRLGEVKFQSPDGRVRRVRAGRCVLAAGGIENARLLLASRGVNPAGIGNDRDLVGRYFHDHPHVNTGVLQLFGENAAKACEQAYPAFKCGSNDILPAVVLSGEVQAQQRTLATAFSLFLERNADASDSYLALRRLLGSSGDGDQGAGFWDDVKLVAADLDGAMSGAFQKAKSLVVKTQSFRLFTRTEQAPNRHSRVMLNDERDAFGLPRVTLDWQLTKLDKHTLKVASTLFGQEIGRLGLGRVQLPDWLASDDETLSEEFHPGCHHMGTTRMAASPEKGVVDADCRLFGVENLYVAGSSVFPTGGYANPTFTIVQLALRLADHLKSGTRPRPR